MTARFKGTLPAIFVLSVLRQGAERGVSAAELLAGTGTTPDELGDPEAAVPVSLVFSAWAALMRHVRDDALPVKIALTFKLEYYPVLGFAVMTAPTAREAIARVARFSGIVTTSARWSVEEHDEVVRLRFHREGPRTLGHRVANESVLAEFVHLARQTLGNELTPLVTSFRHAPPADLRAHREHFGSRIEWQSDADELVFPRAMLDLVPRSSHPALSAHFEQEALRALARVSSDAPLLVRLRNAVELALPSGEPAAPRIAKQLGMSERSLRRALADQGSSFRAVVDDTRHERARLLMQDRRSSLAEVALTLGFSELSAFSRAFKRWTGRSPSDVRAASDQNV